MKKCKHNDKITLDVLRQKCNECGKYFETNPYTGEVKETSEASALFCVETTRRSEIELRKLFNR